MEIVSPHVFGNGLPAVYLHSPGVKVYTLILLVAAGPRFETAETQGIARFYSNLCFQGSQSSPQKEQLDEAMDQLGLSLQPAVYPEYSLFYFSSVEEKFLPSIDLFLKILFQPALTEEGLTEEKKLTASEIEITAKRPDFLSLNKLTSALFNNTSMGFDILGSKESLNNFNPETLTDFKNKYYVSQNCLLVIIGPKKDFSLAELENTVSLIPSGQRQSSSPFDFSQTKIVRDKISQPGGSSYLSLAHLCFGRGSPQRISQSLLINILAEGRNNQRLKTLRKEKLVFSVRPWISIFSDCGLFLTQASCPSTKEKEALERLSEEFKKMGQGSITQEELDKAKVYYQNRLLEKLDNGLELGLFYALGYFFNLEEQTPEAVMEKVKNISLKEINEVAQTIFREESLSWMTVGPGY